MTIDDIKRVMTDAGSHWFDPDTMRWFRSRVHSRVYEGSGGIYFVTSEKPPRDWRKYSVRCFTPATMEIMTAGNFCTIPTSAQAHRIAASLARGDK